MTQNASPDPGTDTDGDGAIVDIVDRTTRRALARRQATYAREVRSLLDAGLEVMRRYGTTRSPRVADILEEAGLSREAPTPDDEAHLVAFCTAAVGGTPRREP